MTPEKHIDNLEFLVANGEWSDELHQRFHQSYWYDWKRPDTVRNHIKYFLRNDRRKLEGANMTYALLIQALVDHYKEADRCSNLLHKK